MYANQEHYSKQGHVFFSFLMRNKFHNQHYGLEPEMKPKVNFSFKGETIVIHTGSVRSLPCQNRT